MGNKHVRSIYRTNGSLAFLMPIVASMGGNAGMQTLAVTIRALATKELSSKILKKLLVKNFLLEF